MEFPISRDRLQRYREKEAAIVDVKRKVDYELHKIHREVEKQVLDSVRAKDMRYVYRISDAVRTPFVWPYNSQQNYTVQTYKILDYLVQEVKVSFPDSRVVVDPLETYILIDWS